MAKHPWGLGPTGKYPYGKLRPDDEGELRIAVFTDEHKNVCIDFGTETTWIALPKDKAIAFGTAIIEQAKEIKDG